MSKKNPSVIDYFDLNGDLNEEAYEFEDVKLEDYIDKRSNVKPSWVGKYSHQMHFDLPDDTEVSFYKGCLLYTSPSPRDKRQSRMPSSA